MITIPEKFSLRLLAFTIAGVFLLAILGWVVYRLYQNREKEFYTIAVFYDSSSQKPQDLRVIQFIIGRKVAEINEAGGIAGRDIRIKYLNDKGNRDTALLAVKNTINDPSLIAYLGCWSSTKAAAVAELVGEKNVPYIGGFSITSLARNYPNMFTYEIGVDQFAYSAYKLLAAKSKRVAIIGNPDDLFTGILLHKISSMNSQNPAFRITVQKGISANQKLTEAELTAMVKEVQEKADFLYLSVNAPQSNAILRTLWKQNTSIPVFSGFVDIPELDLSIPGYQDAELYDISVFGIPSALNMRSQVLKELYRRELKESIKLDFQIGLGALISDAIGLIKATAPTESSAQNMRNQITKGLQEFVNGDKIYHGWFTNWYFTEDRALVNEAVLGWKPATYLSPILAPQQFLRSDTGIKDTPVLYTNIDLNRIDRINDEEGTFNASFYLEINSQKHITVKQIDFANAARNEINHEPLLEIKLMRADSVTGENSIYNYLYKVSGKFLFKRNLKNYPFDNQQFMFTLQTNSAYDPFLIQPPGKYLRDTVFTSPGWVYQSNFVGYDQDVINTASNFINQQTHIPYYKFNYTYVMKRTHVDFFLKVLTPLLAILLITYFSVFIPYREFEALCGIQVTGLLSAIALYFSTYKPEMQNATISDKIFIFCYIMITTIIGTSILTYALHYRKMEKSRLARYSRLYQYYIFPAIVIVFTILIRWQ